MRSYCVVASAVILAPADLVYGILSDYRAGHPHILPPAYFSSLVVEEGGRGAGTVIRFQMSVMGSRRTFRAEVSEPEPGRLLVETDPDTGTRTTFAVLESEDGDRARVAITTELKVRRGFPGLLDRSLTTLMLRRIYAQELKLLSDLARTRSSARDEVASTRR